MIRRLVAGLALVALAPLPVLTSHRVAQWHDEARLWREASEQSPSNVRAMVQLGYFAHRDGRGREADGLYQHAVTLAHARQDVAGCQIATINLTILALQESRWRDAEQWGGHACR